jgi:hypothetical protein
VFDLDAIGGADASSPFHVRAAIIAGEVVFGEQKGPGAYNG